MARPAITWLITDTHLYHDAMVDHCGRPANHTELTIGHLRRMLSPRDTLIHLGDVIFYRWEKLASILASVPGTKYLVQGNHDRKSRKWYREAGFACCVDALSWDGVYLTHKPVQVLPSDCTLNVHGHWHLGPLDTPEWYNTSTHRLLSLERTNYKPTKFSEFIK